MSFLTLLTLIKNLGGGPYNYALRLTTILRISLLFAPLRVVSGPTDNLPIKQEVGWGDKSMDKF